MDRTSMQHHCPDPGDAWPCAVVPLLVNVIQYPELIMWLVMRGALSDNLVRVRETYHVPASNTAAGLALFEDPG